MYTKKELKTKLLFYAYKECCCRAKETPSKMGYCNKAQIIKSLSMGNPHDKYKTYEALHELYSQNLIMKDPHHEHSEDSITLTSKGREIAENQFNIDEFSIRLENFIDRKDVLSGCQDLFNSGKYETAVFSAYRLLEVKIREKANLPAEIIGTDLVNKALSPTTGKLRVPSCATKAEETGVLNLFLGGISSFKNPTSHRIINYDEPRYALRVIVLAELLLSILETCTSRN